MDECLLSIDPETHGQRKHSSLTFMQISDTFVGLLASMHILYDAGLRFILIHIFSQIINYDCLRVKIRKKQYYREHGSFTAYMQA